MESKTEFKRELFDDGDPKIDGSPFEDDDMFEGLDNPVFNGNNKPETRLLPKTRNKNREGHEKYESIVWTQFPNKGENKTFDQHPRAIEAEYNDPDNETGRQRQRRLCACAIGRACQGSTKGLLRVSTKTALG